MGKSKTKSFEEWIQETNTENSIEKPEKQEKPKNNEFDLGIRQVKVNTFTPVDFEVFWKIKSKK